MKILVGLDRDGTINEDEGFFGREPDWKSKLKLHSGVIEGIKLLNQNPEIIIIVATNQPGVARKYFGIEKVEEINKTINELLLKNNCKINNWQYCPYIDKNYLIKKNIDIKNKFVLENEDSRMELRKPKIGMIKRAAKELGYGLEDFNQIYFIGNEITDVQTGLNAGGKGILINNPKKDTKEIAKNPNVIIVQNFLEAVKSLLKDVEK